MQLDPKVIVDSVADGALSALGFFPNVAEGVAKNAMDYAGAVRHDIEQLKTNLPDHPEAIPKVALSVAGQTLGAVIGMAQAFGAGANKTLSDIKAQTERVTG